MYARCNFPRIVRSLAAQSLPLLLVVASATADQPAGSRASSGPERTDFPQRIITIAPNSAEIICALNACGRLVGVSKFCVHPPELKDVPRVGGLFDPNLEKIIVLRPDLVVLRGKNESVEHLCKEQQVPVYYDQTDTLSGVETCIMELGQRLGRRREAGRLVRTFRGHLDAIRHRVAGRPRPRVLLTISRQPGRPANILTAGKGTFLTEMIDIAGGVNVFGHLDMAYPQVSSEAIVAARPEVIIELMPEARSSPDLERSLRDQWKGLGVNPAADDGRIYYLTENHALIPSPRYTEIIEKVSRILHPEDGIEK